jgi:SAM-dependent methyltransferase
MKDPVPLTAFKTEAKTQGYDTLYAQFDSPLMRQIRQEAYGEDIGQHSWVTADELRADIVRLGLSPSSHLLDLGCGPCGPLTFVLEAVGCHGTGAELSAEAIAAGIARASKLELGAVLSVVKSDLNQPLRFADHSFDATMSLDVIVHLKNRAEVFQEVARVLTPKGRFLFTDAGVITGVISSEEVRLRSNHGFTQFVAPGLNEHLLERQGFRILEVEDRTSSVLKNATGRFNARLSHKAELEEIEGTAVFQNQQQYLETVITLSKRGALSRIMYLAESGSL